MTLKDEKEMETPEETPEEVTSEEQPEVLEDEPKEAEEVEIDYAAELARERQERAQISGALKDERKRRKEAEAKLKETDEPVAPGSPESIAAEITQQVERQRAEDDVWEAIEGLTENEAEQDYIYFCYQNRIKPTGYSRKAIRNDVREAYLLANRKKYEADAEKRVRKSMAETEAVKRSSGTPKGSVQEKPKEDWSKYSAEERALLERRGLKPKDVKKEF